MTQKVARHPFGLTSRLLRREKAAAYVDVSPTTFDKLVRAGTIPAPKCLDGFKWWDRADLDAFADDLPYAEQSTPHDSTWD